MLKYKRPYPWIEGMEDKRFTITEAVQDECDSPFRPAVLWGERLNEAEDVAKSAAYLLGQLIEMLHAKGTLNDTDLFTLIPTFEQE